jgi:hypothetical protein
MEEIETPMKMNYRESVAWQLGYGTGWKQAQDEIAELKAKRQYWEDKYKEKNHD